MAVIDKNGNKTFDGAVIGSRRHCWLDGMVDEYAIVWNKENEKIEEVQVGYYGIDGYNFMEATFEVDLNAENARKVLRMLKKEAICEYAISVRNEKAAIKKGRVAEVIKGRKVKKGTRLDVFWVGERPTYRSTMYSYINETEMIAGCYDENGNKVWIKAEYLKNITQIKSPSVIERKRFIKEYIKRRDNVLWSLRKKAMGM